MTTVGFMAWTSFGPFTFTRFYHSEHCDLGNCSVACNGAGSQLMAITLSNGHSERGRIRHCRARSETMSLTEAQHKPDAQLGTYVN